MTQQCAVAGLPRETNDSCFDAANANKSCVRVHGGQSSEFPIYPTTRERGIRVGGGVHDSYTFQCGLVGSFTSPGIDTR